MANPVLWFEVMGADGKALREFYRDLFGWKVSEGNPNNDVDYGLVEADGVGIPGGIGTSPDGRWSFATFVVDVDDLALVVAPDADEAQQARAHADAGGGEKERP